MSLADNYKFLLSQKYIDLNISDEISNNLNPKMELRYYQKEALSFLIHHLEKDVLKKKPTQLLFQMATGSGKTLVMAASMLYLYKKGYRDFIFFVNNTNIIDKTKDNFLESKATKFLFAQKIVIDDIEVNIRSVENFEESNNRDINIWFTTVQGLHSKLELVRENSFTLEDIQEKKIVLISDEAHHINALTKLKVESFNDNLFHEDISVYKGLAKEEAEELKTWEGSVNSIFRQNKDNILLEFTATVELSNPNIKAKYDDKIIYNYNLAQYRLDGFSKNIDILSEDMPAIERSLTAIVLSQFRMKIAEHNGLKIKPVILLKSKTIKESEDFYDLFHRQLKNLTVDDLITIRERSFNNIINRAFIFFNDNGISIDNLLLELKADFEENKTIVVNSKSESEENQRLLNTLEDETNQVRAIFAVDKLNEGWDVLNLFDIVRLYETRDTKANKPGSYTIAEAQLIGRGARYCPFNYGNKDKFKRKFDGLHNDLSILEQLHYHSRTDSKYISELKKALVESGISPDEKDKMTIKIKDIFKETELWKHGLVFSNDRIDNDFSGNVNIKAMGLKREYHKEDYSYKADEESLLSDGYVLSPEQSKIPELPGKMISLFDENLLRFAMNCVEFYKFDNLKRYFPNLKSANEFLTSDDYIGCINVTLKGVTKSKPLSRTKQLKFATDIFRDIESEIKSKSYKYLGTRVFSPDVIKKVFTDKDLFFEKKTAHKV